MINELENENLFSDYICLKEIGIDINDISKIELIHNKNESILFRFEYLTKSYVAKCFKENIKPVEAENYLLLKKLGIPTLQVYGQSKKLIVLEDLNSSPAWRLATEEDINQWQTGVAVADWYLTFHSKGREYLSNKAEVPEFLRREIDDLSAQELYGVGQKLNLASNAAWNLAVDELDRLKQATDLLTETFNYNDFYWTNLALSRACSYNILRAIIFDYHLMGRGFAYSDCRNVSYSLEPVAREAFWETYGRCDEKEKILDEPTSILYTLYVASKRHEFPEWGLDDLKKVRNGQFEKSLQKALDLIR